MSYTTKQQIRDEMRKRVALLSKRDKTSQSDEITTKLLKHPKYVAAKKVGIYISLEDEVNTNQIIKNIFTSGKVCYIPRYEEKDNVMRMLRMSDADEYLSMPKTKWNVSQPAQPNNREDAMELGNLDVIVVPGRAFSERGERLGRGRGYYDVFFSAYDLRHPKNSLYKIGLAFRQQLLQDIPVDEHDYKLHCVIHPDYNHN